jgi:hypothetical protein
MSSIATDLAQWLDRVERHGDFFCSGTCEILAPGLGVEGVGPIALPLLPVQTAQLIAVAERAPYGRGAQTLVDTEVRRTWQIDPERIRIDGRGWARSLETIVGRVAEGLGVNGAVVADLYKLLVYDEGAFFVSHRDTEKSPGMFATLVIVLPSAHAGGELVVRHQGREVRLHPRGGEPSEVGFAAFYADCQHEVLPVTSGCRLTLVYNLLRHGKGPPPLPPSYSDEQDRLAALLREWSGPDSGVDAPKKLIYPLEHAYTESGLSFAALKGADAARASVLTAAAGQADCDLHLALVSIDESGDAEHVGGYYGYGSTQRDRQGSFEAGEVIERIQTLSGWCSPDGDTARLGTLPIIDDEASPPDAFDDLVPDEESFEEATGNAGASFERRYRIAAFVLWPGSRRFAVINQGGLSTTLPCLADLAQRWSHSSKDDRRLLGAQAQDLAHHMLASWPIRSWRSSQSPSDAATMLALLHQFGDAAHVDAFLADVSAAGVLDKGDGKSIVQALDLLPPPRAEELLQRIVAAQATRPLDACADLLLHAAMAESGQVDLVPAAATLVSDLPGDPKRRPAPPSWEQPQRIEPTAVADMLRALVRIDPALADAAVNTLLAWPATYPADALLIPAIVALGQSDAIHAPAVARLAAAGIAHLQARIGEHLAPPADWERPGKLTCQCQHCRNLAAFLTDPDRATWHFKSIQTHRSHVEDTIRTSHCDLDTQTIRQGSPHTLVCSKNQASYERRARQREQDLQHLAVFEERWPQAGSRDQGVA